jgi:hypothetical protein
MILTADRVSLGRAGSSARPDIGLPADIAGYHAEIQRLDEDYFAIAAQGQVAVGGRSAPRRLLADGDAIELGPRCRLTFRLPTKLSAAAVLRLDGLRVDGDVRDIILAAGHFLVGRGPNCHVEARGGGAEPVVLSVRGGEVFCRAKEEIVIDGKGAGREALIPLGAAVDIGDLTFTITTAGA